MINKDKILVFLVVLFSVFIIFSSKVFASTETYSFTGFDGKDYSLPPFIEELTEYNHYVMVMSPLTKDITIVPFKETFEMKRCDTHTSFLCDGHDYDFYFSYDSGDNKWLKGGTSVGGAFHLFSKDDLIIYSCPCMQPYSKELSDGMKNENGFFLSRQEILAPITEKAPLAEVMKEIMKILPVIILTLVGLIGLRKALAMLSTLLHRS